MSIKVTGKQRVYAEKLLDELKRFDAEVQSAQYEMGRILSAIKHGKLWDLLGYESMRHMCEEELSYSPNTAMKYVRAYRGFQRLGYTKTEALKIIHECSFTLVSKVLPKLKDKVGIRAIQSRIEKLDVAQVNFQLTKAQKEHLDQWLIKYGAMRDEDTGYMLNASNALMAIVEWKNGKKKAA